MFESQSKNTSTSFVSPTTEKVSESTSIISAPYNSGQLSKWQNFKDSFKRQESVDGDRLDKKITKRHLRSMALTTGLGTGLLVGAGSKLASAGPLFLLVGYFIVGFFLVVPCIYAVGELSVAYVDLPGGFQSYYSKFMEESMAFAIGWNYCIQWLSVISLELVTASMTVKFWNESIHPDIIVTIFFIVVIAINVSGSRFYGEAEFIMNSCKILMLCGFIIFGLIVDLGGGPVDFIGGKYWRDPGAYTSFKGLCTVFVTGAFSMGGTEFISLSAAELQNPKQAIPAACKLVYLKVLVIFLGSLTFVGLLVPYTSDRLMGASGGSQSHASPYVLAAELNGVKVLPSIINAVILISVTSVASAGMYSSQRLLYSLAKQGFAPKIFDYIDRKGRPITCFAFVVFVSFFSYIAAYEKQETVFNWLLSISGLSFIFCWSSICICHLRFRAALRYHKIPLSSLGFVSTTGEIGSWLSLTLNILILVGQFWIGLFPSGSNGKADVLSFFEGYLGFIILIVFYIGHKLYTRNGTFWIKLEDIDIETGRVVYEPEELELERQEIKQRWERAPIWKKILIFLFD